MSLHPVPPLTSSPLVNQHFQAPELRIFFSTAQTIARQVFSSFFFNLRRRLDAGGELPRRRPPPVSRVHSIVLSAPFGLQPHRRARYQPVHTAGVGRGGGGPSYSSHSRGHNENGCRATCFPIAPPLFKKKHQGALWGGGGAEGSQSRRRVFPGWRWRRYSVGKKQRKGHS